MDEIQKTAVAYATGIATFAVPYLINWAVYKWNDRIRLRTRLSVGSSLETIEEVGCAGLDVTVTSYGHRIAKLERVELRAIGVDLLPQFQKAFGCDFGHISVDDTNHPPYFQVELLQLSKHDLPKGSVLERDDVCRFMLPIRCPGFNIFGEIESESVRLIAVLFNQDEIELARGIAIQRGVNDVIDAWGDKVQTLNKPLKFGLHGLSAVLPNPSAVGTLNPKPLTLDKNAPGVEEPTAPDRIDFALDCTVAVGDRADTSNPEQRRPSIIACFQTHADRFSHSMDLQVAHKLAVSILAAFDMLGHKDCEKALTVLGVKVQKSEQPPPPVV